MREGRTILPGLRMPCGIEQVLDRLEGLGEPRPELPAHPFRAHQPVAMLARVGALVFAHQRRGLLGDRAHLGRTLAAHVEDRPHMQRADRACAYQVPRVPCLVKTSVRRCV